MWNAVGVGEHGLEAVVDADVVQDAHGYLLLALIDWKNKTQNKCVSAEDKAVRHKRINKKVTLYPNFPKLFLV